jgi:signal peptidase I
MKIFREVGIAILIAVAIFVFLRFNVQGYTVQYSSMLPSIEEGEWVMVNKASYFFSDPQRGDVVVFDPPISSKYPFIKRVIALPSDTVEIKDGKVFINGIPLEEKYIMAPPNYEMPAEKMPEKHYFVLGDNRNNSNDSHNGWTVPRDDIIGKAWFTYWPANKWGVVKHYSYPELLGAGGQEIVLQSLGVIT